MNKEEKELIEQYEKLMEGAPLDFRYCTWEKEGEIYKEFSLYDTSKYESTVLNQNKITDYNGSLNPYSL